MLYGWMKKSLALYDYYLFDCFTSREVPVQFKG